MRGYLFVVLGPIVIRTGSHPLKSLESILIRFHSEGARLREYIRLRRARAVPRDT